MIGPYKILHDAAPVAAIVGTRIYREFAGDAPVAPYVVWGLLAALPSNNLSNLPPSDRYSVTVDCFSLTEADSDVLMEACRDAMEAAGHVLTIQSLGRESETKLWRYNFDAELFKNR